jgi:hypothetical protein
MSRQTLTEDVKEPARADGVMPEGRSRKAGGWRKTVRETRVWILDTLEEPVSARTKGDPMTALDLFDNPHRAPHSQAPNEAESGKFALRLPKTFHARTFM